MPLTTVMRDLFTKFMTTEDSTSERFGSTSAWIWVGSSTTGFLSSQTSVLTTSTDPERAQPMDSGYPKRNDGTDSTGANIWAGRGTWTTSEANFAWNEVAVRNTSATAAGTGTAMTRFVPELGTKANTQSWQLTCKITVST